MLKRKKILSKLLATTMVLTSFTVNASAAEVTTSTIGGNNRYETAIKISENGWSKSDHAVLINGEKGLVDALTATPYAYAKNSPILITKQAKLTSETGARLSAMGVKSVTVVGGTNSVSDAVVNEIKAKGISVERIYGASRYSTSLAVAKELDKLYDVGKVAVVNGQKGLPDAVSVAAPAASNRMPIILADNKGIDAASKAFIDSEDITNSYVIGSLNSVSDATMNSLPGSKVRLGGADRHDTNAEVIKAFYTDTNLNRVYVAKSGKVKTEDEIVDALAAGVLAAKNGNPVVIVGNSLNTSQQSLLASKKFNNLVQIGMGVPTNALNQIKATQADAEATATSVSVVNYKTITIKGSNLNLIDKSKVSIAGNPVDSYTANANGTEATVVFDNAFAASNTVKIVSNVGNTKEFTFTYSTNVSNVQASSKKVATGTASTLELTVNGSDKRTVSELRSQGWKVEFKSKSENLFYGTTTTDEDEFNVSETGRLNDLEAGETHSYKVVITNGSTVYESGLTAFEVVDEASLYESIVSTKLNLTISTNASASVKTDVNTLVQGESAIVGDIEVKDSLGNTKNVPISQFDITSEDTKILGVQGSNLITTGGNGTARITVKKGNLSKSFNVVVKANEKREFKKAILSKTSISLATGISGTIDVKLLDQFDTPWTGAVTDIPTEVKNGNNEIASITNTKVANSDLMTLNITAIADADLSGTVSIGNQTLTVKVGKDTDTTKYQFEALKGGKTSLDVYTPNKDEKEKEVILGINGSTKTDYSTGKIGYDKIGFADKTPTTAADFGSNDYLVVSNTKDIVGLINDTDGIKATAKKSGNTTLHIYNKNTLGTSKGSIPISVVDSTPKLSSLDFEYMEGITEASTVDIMEKLFDIRDSGDEKVVNNIKVSGVANKIIVENTGNDYKFYANNTDTPIATISIVNSTNATLTDGKLTVVKGSKGSIVVNVYKTGVSSVYKQKEIKVEVK